MKVISWHTAKTDADRHCCTDCEHKRWETDDSGKSDYFCYEPMLIVEDVNYVMGTARSMALECQKFNADGMCKLFKPVPTDKEAK